MLVVVTVSRTWNSDRMCQQTQSWTLFTEQVACFKQSVRHGPWFPHYCRSIYFKLARLILVCSSVIQVAIDPGLRVAVSGVLRRTGYLGSEAKLQARSSMQNSWHRSPWLRMWATGHACTKEQLNTGINQTPRHVFLAAILCNPVDPVGWGDSASWNWKEPGEFRG